jgi:hypothetical protein
LYHTFVALSRDGVVDVEFAILSLEESKRHGISVVLSGFAEFAH